MEKLALLLLVDLRLTEAGGGGGGGGRDCKGGDKGGAVGGGGGGPRLARLSAFVGDEIVYESFLLWKEAPESSNAGDWV